MPKALSTRVVEGIGKLTITQGAGAGQTFRVLPWQARFVGGMLRPGVYEAALSVGRGNGKTTLCAAIAVAALVGPLRRPRSETVIVASSFGQARIAFEHVKAFLAPALQANDKRFRVLDSSQTAAIEDRETGCRVRALGSDPKRAHGLAPVLILADEPAQWPGGTADAMRAALATSMGKVDGGRFVALGTRPADEGHWFARMLEPDGAAYRQTHAAAADDPPFRARTWAKANPSLPIMPALRDKIETEARRAARDAGELAAFRALRLNLGEADTAQAMLIDAGLWREIEAEPVLPFGPETVFGVDLGAGAAFSALAAYDAATGRLDGLAMTGDVPSLAERGLVDGVGKLYADLSAEGTLLVEPGRVPSPAALLREGLKRFGRPVAIVADRWREGELRDALQAAGFPPAALITRGMGYRDGGQDVRAFQAACAGGQAFPRRCLLFRAALGEARTVSDPAGNRKLAKGNEGGRRFRARDDVAAAAILAVAEGVRRRGAPRPAFRYGGLV